jgi:hypothetical protein
VIKLIYLTLFFLLPFTINAQCNKKKFSNSCSELLGEYYYDGSVSEKIDLDTIAKSYEIEFVAFSGQDLKLVFCSSELNAIHIKVFDKPKTSKKREIVYNSLEDKNETKSWEFKSSKVTRYFIEYIVPPREQLSKKSLCFSMIIGFKGISNK